MKNKIMKKYILILATIFAFSCSSSEEEITQNPFIGNSYTANDPIASIIHGNGSTTTIEFLTETNCQRIEFRASGPFAGNVVKQGTYVFEGNKVTWTVDDEVRTANLSGTILISTVVINGNPITYQKN
ncbi:hypothetical protein [uncultured Polaribacter sp.]|uniref:hypothetical protein n=1 Tax=uncultured Polaribacter sp. TaxID=174711 RepID=UPI0026193341|nr:hypothetical protein [uncultured Polaribacter sp.]